MFLASLWLEIYSFQAGHFADIQQLKVDIYFANIGKIRIDPICSLLLTFDML